MKKPNSYKFIIRCLLMSFLLNGTISFSAAVATLFAAQSVWVEMAMRFHFLCYLAEYTLLTLFILFLNNPRTEAKLETGSYKYRPNRFLALAILFAICWIFLTDGNAITSPRYAYQNLRAGIGPIWAGMIVFSTMYFITKTVNLERITIHSFLFFVLIGYMSGSKMALVTAVLFPLFLPQVKTKIRFVAVPFFTILSAVAFVSMFGGISFFTNTGQKLFSYFNMFHLSSRVFEDISIGSMKLHYGSINISKLWAYIPRSIVPNKPFTFGPSYFVEYYFPGMAETGATPSFGMFTMYFADFWWFGVLISIFRVPVFMQLWAIYQLTRVTKHSWKLPFASGFLLFPTMSFHIPLLLCFIGYWMTSRFKVGSK